MFRHVVMFRWSEAADDAAKAAALAALARLPATIDSVRAFGVGSDAGLSEGNFDLVVVSDFDDATGYLSYRDHPTHQQVIQDRLAPIVAERSAVQYEIRD